MRTRLNLWLFRRVLPLAFGSAFFLNGCDAQTKATIEDGIISSSSSLLGAFLQAAIALATEQATNT